MSISAVLDVEDLAQRLARRLDPLDALRSELRDGDLELNGAKLPVDVATLTKAAVLAAIVRRPEGWTLLLTQRTNSMPTHAGQIAFPGGRVQEEDDGPIATALRECEEETGIERRLIFPIGGLNPIVTGTGFYVTPIVAYLEPGFEVRADPREVAAVFETPLAFLFNPINHQTREGEWRGIKRKVYAMPYDGRYIWGVTAGIIRALYERLYD